MFFQVREFPPQITNTTIKKGDVVMEEKGMFGGFDPTMMIDEALKTMRFSFDVALDNMMKVQDFNLKVLKDMLERSKDVQADAVQAVSDFIESARKGRDEYKKMITEGLEKVGGMLARKK